MNNLDPSGLVSTQLIAAAITATLIVALLGLWVASDRGLLSSSFDGIPIPIWTQPVVIRESGWDVDEVEATVDSASVLWMRMAGIRIFHRPVIEYRQPGLLNLPSTQGGYTIPAPGIEDYPGHLTLFNISVPGACGAAMEAKALKREFLPAHSYVGQGCAGDAGLHLAHEFGHHLLEENDEGLTLDLMHLDPRFRRATIPPEKARAPRSNATRNPIWGLH